MSDVLHWIIAAALFSFGSWLATREPYVGLFVLIGVGIGMGLACAIMRYRGLIP